MAAEGVHRALSLLTWALALGTGVRLLWREMAPGVRQARQAITAAAAWRASAPQMSRRWRVRLALLIAAGFSASVAWGALLRLTSTYLPGSTLN
ncbi:MAG: hypothetical protein AB1609_08190 [Bacillota bacterium]